jgi:hypothetical protein
LKKIKHQCEECGAVTKASWKDFFKYYFNSALVALGLIFIALLIIAGPISVLNMYVTGFITYGARMNHEEVRDLAINLTVNCERDPGNKDCLAWALFYSLKDDFRYVPDSLIKHQGFDVERVMNKGSDCKYAAALYTTLSRSIGVDARIECDTKHCVSVIPFNATHKTVVDLTVPVAYNVKRSESWSVINELNETQYWEKVRWI